MWEGQLNSYMLVHGHIIFCEGYIYEPTTIVCMHHKYSFRMFVLSWKCHCLPKEVTPHAHEHRNACHREVLAVIVR